MYIFIYIYNTRGRRVSQGAVMPTTVGVNLSIPDDKCEYFLYERVHFIVLMALVLPMWFASELHAIYIVQRVVRRF